MLSTILIVFAVYIWVILSVYCTDLLCSIKDLLSVYSKPHQASERRRGLNPFYVGCGGGWEWGVT